MPTWSRALTSAESAITSAQQQNALTELNFSGWVTSTGSLHNTGMQCSRLHGFLTTPLRSMHASGTVFYRPRVLLSSKVHGLYNGSRFHNLLRRGMSHRLSDLGRLQHNRILPTQCFQCLPYADTKTLWGCWCNKRKSRELFGSVPDHNISLDPSLNGRCKPFQARCSLSLEHRDSLVHTYTNPPSH